MVLFKNPFKNVEAQFDKKKITDLKAMKVNILKL